MNRSKFGVADRLIKVVRGLFTVRMPLFYGAGLLVSAIVLLVSEIAPLVKMVVQLIKVIALLITATAQLIKVIASFFKNIALKLNEAREYTENAVITAEII